MMTALASSPTQRLAHAALTVPPGVRIPAGVALIAGGAFLWAKPLTALHVLVWAVALGLVALAGIAVAGIRRQALPSTAAALALAACGVACVLLRGPILTVLPYAAAPLLALLALATVWRALYGRHARRAVEVSRAEPVRTLAWALAAALGAVLAAWWPDLGGLALAGAAGVGAVVAGVTLLAARRVARTAGTPRTRWSTVWRWTGAVTTVLLLVASVAGSVVIRCAVPRIGDFYEWADALPTTPGVLLRTEPYDGEVPAGAHALRILYTTTYADGTIALASGVVAIPDAPATTARPVVAWQHGTTGVDRTCAPSLSDRAINDVGIPGVEQMIDRGWLVVATDYPGMGTGGRYPYLIGEGEGRAALDAIRASAGIEDAMPSDHIMLWGHSQGGHASLWAAQIAATYAPEFTLTSVVALSAASAPLTLAERITARGSSISGNLATAYVLLPYADEYPDVNVADAVDPAARVMALQLSRYCAIHPTIIVAAIDGLAVTAWNDRNPFNLDVSAGPLRERLELNTPSGDFDAPLFLGQGVQDEVIPIEIQRAFSARQCAAGKDVVTREYDGYNHNGVIAAGAPLIEDMMAWADAVLAGEHPTGCVRG